MSKKPTEAGLPGWARIVFIVLFLLPMVSAALIPLFGQRDMSVSENRSLTKLPALSWSSFRDGSFQDQLEDALIDQVPGGEAVKNAALDAKNSLLKLQQGVLYAAAPQLKSNYAPIAEGYYHYAGDEHRIVESPSGTVTDQAALERMAADFAGLPEDMTVCLFFIENSRVIDFDRPESGRVYQAVVDAIRPDRSDVFAVPDYDAYCGRFYQTDHHWTIDGAYAGYRQIHRLLHGTDEGMIPDAETVRIDAVFQGSYARQTRVLCADETFGFKSFGLPKYSTFINGRKKNYGNVAMYERGKYASEAMTNHYANCFGGDFGEIVYDFGTEGRGSLLLVASSYSNPINALIASGYDKTYVIDLRYYEAWAGEAFDPAAYCEKNGIGTVLLLGDVKLFYASETAEEVE